MKNVLLNGHSVALYDNIEDLPINRFHKYNKLLLIDGGVGADLESVNQHLITAVEWLKEKNTDNAIKELENLRQCLVFVNANINPSYLSFAVLVKSIDGNEITDISDDALKDIVKKLGNVPHKDITTTLAEVKKKIDEDLKDYFPKLFDSVEIKEYFDLMKRRTLLILQAIEKGVSTEQDKKELDKVNHKIITFYKPRKYSGSNGVEVMQDKQFKKMCLLISKELHVNPSKFSVLEFYNAFEYIQETNKTNQKALRHK